MCLTIAKSASQSSVKCTARAPYISYSQEVNLTNTSLLHHDASSNFTCLQTIFNVLKDTKRHLFVILHFIPSTFWQYMTPIFAFQNYSRTRNGTWVGNRIATAMFYVSKQDSKYFQSKSVS